MVNKIRREIIHIDEELCDGCGLCVPACAEGALQIIDGKARLVGEQLCDGLGACLGDCPRGAITVETREAEAFDAQAVEEHLRSTPNVTAEGESTGEAACAICYDELLFEKKEEGEEQKEKQVQAPFSSGLAHWPIQLRLVSSGAKFLENPHWLVVADCVPFAFADFHRHFSRGKALLIGCPKLDDASFYFQKLVEILQKNAPERITVLTMDVACCSGLNQLVSRACAQAGAKASLEKVVITIDGKIKS